MTLIATVLLSVLAATITVIVVRQVLIMSSSEGGKTNVTTVENKVGEVQALFERQLVANPEFYLSSTFAYERPRMCTSSSAGAVSGKYVANTLTTQTRGNAVVITPTAQTWPVQCGTAWTYPPVQEGVSIPAEDLFNVSGSPAAPVLTQASSPWTPSSTPTRAEVIPPSPGDPSLTLRILSSVGPSEVGSEAHYLRNAASQWTLYSSKTIDLSTTVSAGTLGAGSTVYSSDRVVLPSGQTSLTLSVVAGENGVDGLPSTSGARLLSGDASQLKDATGKDSSLFFDIRSAASQPLSLEALRSSVVQTQRVGCPALTSAPVNTEAELSKRSTYLCLAAGKSVTNTQGSTIALPATAVTAWLVTLGESSTDAAASPSTAVPAISIFYASQPLNYVSDCLVACDLDLASVGLSSSGADPTIAPGLPGSPWLPLTATPGGNEFYYPLGGVIATDADTFISTQANPSNASASLTLLAGTLSNPADVVIGGDISTSTSSLLGLIATRSMLIPYFASSIGGSTEVSASLAALGLGTTLPATRGVPYHSVPFAGPQRALVLTGSVASSGIGDIQAASNVSLLPDSRLRASQPPMFAAFGPTWHSSSEQSITSGDICGDLLSSSVSSCTKLW